MVWLSSMSRWKWDSWTPVLFPLFIKEKQQKWFLDVKNVKRYLEKTWRNYSISYIRTFDEADEYCPGCDNHYIIDAKTPTMGMGIESDDPRVMRDFRERQKQWIENDLMADRLG